MTLFNCSKPIWRSYLKKLNGQQIIHVLNFKHIFISLYMQSSPSQGGNYIAWKWPRPSTPLNISFGRWQNQMNCYRTFISTFSVCCSQFFQKLIPSARKTEVKTIKDFLKKCKSITEFLQDKRTIISVNYLLYADIMHLLV